MQGKERAIYTLSVQRPQPFRIVLFISKFLQRIGQNIYSISLYTELYQRKKLIKLCMQCRNG